MTAVHIRLAGLGVCVLLLSVAFVRAQRRETKIPPAQLTFSAEFYRDVPAKSGAETRGATEPAWSRDGKFLAFSLHGSIWRMAQDGSVAEQVTTESGYDGGPSWSPDGKRIAFVRGQRPMMGTQIGVLGKLIVVAVDTGHEQTLAPDRQFVGTPIWAADGRSLIASDQQGAQVNLYRVPLDGGTPERLTGMLMSRVPTIVQRGSGWFYYWYPAALHPSGDVIAFASDRDGTPQLWRMPLDPGIVVSRKLTNYAERDQADIQDLCWMNENTILFSANLHSERTNFDLWRWREGSEAQRLTNTIHDEFSPRLSPDRKQLVFVSNYLGNLDLYTTTPDLAQAQHLPIRSLKFRRPSGRLSVKVVDNSGKLMAARVSVRASDGKFYNPAGSMFRFHAGMGESAGFFHASGVTELEIPAGPARITAFHGFEHESAETSVDVRADGVSQAELGLERRLEWQGKGWWSGEDHIHANYAGPYYMRPEDAVAIAEAEDLNVANMLAANAEGERAYDREFFEGRPSSVSRPGHILYWNEEYRNRIVYGHMALLNLKELTVPMFTSFEGTSSPFDYPSNTMIAADARAKNAVVDYVHPMVGPARDPFDSTVSAKELPVTAALGYVDVMDIYPWGPVSLEMWYRLLNCGFRIAPGAGTDTFTNWRSINQLPGNSRVMVRSDQPLSYAVWIDGLRKGRSFVTNGPMLHLRVNGKEPGDILRSNAGQPLTLDLSADIESLVPLDKIEVIINGRVVAERLANKQRRLRWSWQHRQTDSGWLALRVSGEPSARSLGFPAQAHSAPLYIEVGGVAMRPHQDDARFFVTWVDRLADLVNLRNNFEKPEHKRQVHELFSRARAFYVEAAR